MTRFFTWGALAFLVPGFLIILSGCADPCNSRVTGILNFTECTN